MLTPTHPATKSEQEQTNQQIAQLQGAIDKTFAYLSLAIEHQLNAINDIKLKETVKEKLLTLQAKLAPKQGKIIKTF